MRPDEKHEEDFIIRPIVSRLNSILKPVTTVDYGDIDNPDRPFETFELYFALPPSTYLVPSTVDGYLFLAELVDEAVEAIQKRFERLSSLYEDPIKGIGIATTTKWQFANEVSDAEAMLGDLDIEDYPGKFTLYARFVAPVELIASRCITEIYKVPEILPPWPWKEIERSLGVDHQEVEDLKAEKEGRAPSFSWEGGEVPPNRQLPPSKEENNPPGRPWYDPPQPYSDEED